MSKVKKVYKLPRPYTELGSMLQVARESRGLTQREVSQKLGYSSAQFISNFERGISAPPLKKARVLVQLYGLSPELVIKKQLEGERQLMREALGA